MGLRGQNSSPDPLLTLHVPGPQFSHLQNEPLEEILFEVNPGTVFMSLSQSFVWVDSSSTKRDQLGESDLLGVSSGHFPQFFWVPAGILNIIVTPCHP